MERLLKNSQGGVGCVKHLNQGIFHVLKCDNLNNMIKVLKKHLKSYRNILSKKKA